MKDFIVKRIPEDAEHRDLEEPLDDVTVDVEPSLFPQTKRLVPQYVEKEWQSGYQRHLEHRIQRNPRDLYTHVRRALSYHTVNDTESGFGALVDLFLILGSRGRRLREKMLDQYEDRLSRQQYRFLCSHLISGLHASEPLPAGTRSLLAKGVSGTTQIVVRSDEQEGESRVPVISARRRLADGDVAGAQALLEAAVREDPGSVEICRELLDLYREEGLRDDFFATYAECLSRDLAVPELWEETEKFFRQSPPKTGPEDVAAPRPHTDTDPG